MGCGAGAGDQREEALRYLHRVYVHGVEPKDGSGLEQAAERERQHEYLERKNSYLATKAKAADAHASSIKRRCREENTVILTDLSALQRTSKADRAELEELRSKVRAPPPLAAPLLSA